MEKIAELHSLYKCPDIVKVVKSGRVRWAGHVARMEAERGVYKVGQVYQRAEDH